ncbi:hypothetical protein CPC08DRAFT_824064 [Agrocybe pediades]|nr:hypothetical protein CPC08DRAFT_824064 [Agrocybe pediades]
MLPRSPIISSNQGVLITGGQFTQNNDYHGQASLGSKPPIDILTEAVAPNALHNSGATFDKSKCHPRTRVKAREIIMSWIVLERDKDDQEGKQFMWLNGAAGCGKSAIAQSTIESCIERGVLLASFFFNRSDPTRNHEGSLIATLAYQLYCAFPETEVQTQILYAIKKDPLIFKKTLQEQFTALILEPLTNHLPKPQSTQQPVPFLIVIDGLDECIDRNAQKAVLTGLAETFRNSNLCVPIFVASRPEHDIKLSFGSKFLKDIHTRLSLDLEDEDNADSDIRLYLFDRFAEIKDDFDNRTAGRKLAPDWPGDGIIETLVEKSSSQFIYAATVIRYVESTRHRPDHRLDVVLNLRPVKGEHPFAQLDSLYGMILESAMDIENILRVLSLYLMGPYVSFSVIEKLLSYDEGEVETLFCDMGALVQVRKLRDDQLYLEFLHASFREYLVDAARSKQHHIDMDYTIIRHVTYMLQYLASCCPSPFNPESSTAVIAMYYLGEMQFQMAQRVGQITISLELRQSILSFPLKEFLEPHSTSPNTYQKLLKNFVTPFLQLLEAMVIIDPTLSYIQDHQLGILRSVLMRQLQRYFNNYEQTLVLVLFYHLGSHRFVPIVDDDTKRNAYYTCSLFLLPDLGQGDILSLSRIWYEQNHLHRANVYHRFVRQLLRDIQAGQTKEYALGPIVHERATLACFKELAKLLPSLPPEPFVIYDEEEGTHRISWFCGKGLFPITDNAEDNIDANLVFDALNGGLEWIFEHSEGPGFRDEELQFFLLGYLIFLLPRCGRSDALVAACKHHDQLLDFQYDCFPVRARELHDEIDRYLERVESPNMIPVVTPSLSVLSGKKGNTIY